MFNFVRNLYESIRGGSSLVDAVRVDISKVLSASALNNEDSSRKEICDAIEDMDSTDPIVNAALSISAETALMFPESNKPLGFEIRSDSKRVLNILEDMCDRTGLRDMSYDLVRSMLKFGSIFAEIVYNDDMQIERIKLFPMPYWIRKNEDEYGRLKDGPTSTDKGPGVAAYDEFQDGVTYIASFDEYQILHLAHGDMQGRPYATPRLRSAISVWKTYRAVRDTTAIKSIIGGSFTRLHKIPMPWGYSDAQKRAEMQKYMRAFGSRTTVTVDNNSNISINREPKIPIDIYVPQQIRADGQTVGPDMEIKQYPAYNNDFENLNVWINMIITCLRVPPNYIFWSVGDTATQRALNIDKLDQQFVKAVRRLQEDYKKGLRRLFDLELIANGIAPAERYEIIMPDIYPHTLRDVSKTRFTQAQAIAMGIEAGLDPEWWTAYVLSVDEDEIPKIDKGEAEVPTNQPGDVGRPPVEET